MWMLRITGYVLSGSITSFSVHLSSFGFICVKHALADAGQTFRISQVELVKTGIISRMLGPRGALTPFIVSMIIDDAGFGCPIT